MNKKSFILVEIKACQLFFEHPIYLLYSSTYTFNELWYGNGIFYQKAVDKFRCLEVLDEIKRKQTKKGLKEYIYKYVYAEDKNNKQRKIYIKKFTKSNL